MEPIVTSKSITVSAIGSSVACANLATWPMMLLQFVPNVQNTCTVTYKRILLS